MNDDIAQAQRLPSDKEDDNFYFGKLRLRLLKMYRTIDLQKSKEFYPGVYIIRCLTFSTKYVNTKSEKMNDLKKGKKVIVVSIATLQHEGVIRGLLQNGTWITIKELIPIENQIAILKKFEFGSPLHRLNLKQYHQIELLEKSGSGNAADIYKANCSTYGTVALKIFHIDSELNSMERNLREIKCMRNLNHRNVVTYNHYFIMNNRLHVIMKFYEYGDLKKYMNDLHFMDNDNSNCWIQNVIQQICSGLHYLHENNLVHGDVKPENIMVHKSENGQKNIFVLIDFGLANKRKKFEWIHEHGGTAAYMAPERWDTYSTELADMWAIGVLAYEMCCGELPFKSGSKFCIIENFTNDTSEKYRFTGYFPPEEKIELSSHCRDFIFHLLQASPKDRLTAIEALSHPWLLLGRSVSVIENKMFSPQIVYAIKNSSKANNLRNLIGKVMTRCLPHDHLNGIIEDFQRSAIEHERGYYFMDLKLFNQNMKNSDSMLTTKDLQNNNLNKLFQQMDKDEDGIIDLDEFLIEIAFSYYSQDDRFAEFYHTLTNNKEITPEIIFEFHVSNDVKIGNLEDIVSVFRNEFNSTKISRNMFLQKLFDAEIISENVAFPAEMNALHSDDRRKSIIENQSCMVGICNIFRCI